MGDDCGENIEWDQPRIERGGEHSIAGLRSRGARDRGARKMTDAVDGVQDCSNGLIYGSAISSQPLMDMVTYGRPNDPNNGRRGILNDDGAE